MTNQDILEVIDVAHLSGEEVPASMIEKMSAGSGNDLDDKCCHCSMAYRTSARPQKEDYKDYQN